MQNMKKTIIGILVFITALGICGVVLAQSPCYAPCDTLNGWHCRDMSEIETCSCDYELPYEGGQMLAPATCVQDMPPSPCHGPCWDDFECHQLPGFCGCNFNIPYFEVGFPPEPIFAPGTCVEMRLIEQNPCFAPCQTEEDCRRIGPHCTCDLTMPFDYGGAGGTKYAEGTCVPEPVVPEFPLTAIPAGLALISYGLMRRRR